MRIIDIQTNAPLVYCTVISLHVSTLLGHHQGYTQNTKSLQIKMCIKYLHKNVFLSVYICSEGKC